MAFPFTGRLERREVETMKTLRTLNRALMALLSAACVASAHGQTNSVIALPAHPFGVAVSRDRHWIYVSLLMGEKRQGPSLAVLRNQHGQVELLRTIPTSSAPGGLVLTHDDKTLIAAAGDSVLFFDTHRLNTGASDPVFHQVSDGPKSGSLYLNLTADDQTLFVSDEDTQTITVIGLAQIRSFRPPWGVHLHRRNLARAAETAMIGKIPVGIAPIALMFSKDRRWLFMTARWPRQTGVAARIRAGKPQARPGEGPRRDGGRNRRGQGEGQARGSVVARVPADGETWFLTNFRSQTLQIFDVAHWAESCGKCSREVPILCTSKQIRRSPDFRPGLASGCSRSAWLRQRSVRIQNKPGAVRMMPERGSSMDFPNNSQHSLHFN